MGFSDRRLAELAGKQPRDVRALRKSLGIHPAYKRIADYAGADNVKKFRDIVEKHRKG